MAGSGASPPPERDRSSGTVRLRWPTLLLLAAGLVATALFTRQAQREVVAKARREFEFAGDATGIEVRERLQAHEQILLGGVGLFAASEAVK